MGDACDLGTASERGATPRMLERFKMVVVADDGFALPDSGTRIDGIGEGKSSRFWGNRP